MNKTIIAVFCYKRYAKLRQSMEALLKNPECAEMDIIFFSDGFKGEHDKDGVLRTRAYIDSLKGFGSVTKRYRDRNFSTGPNFETGLKYLCAHYDQFIVIEDDLVVSPNFLRYMLAALDFYRHEPEVFTISGYSFALDLKSYAFDTFIHERFCCYGWASWSDRVSQVEWNPVVLNERLENSRLKKQLDSEGLDLVRTLRKQLSGAISTWDIQMQVRVAEAGLKCVYPVISKGFNIGFDNESTNTFGVDYLKTTVDDGQKRTFRFSPLSLISPDLQRQTRQPYMLPALATRKIVNSFLKLTNKGKKAPTL